MDFAKDFSNEARKAIDHLKEELQGIRTGRPASNILDTMSVDAYGGSTKMKLMEMATISAEGSNTLAVTPFDPSTLQDIEKSIQKSPLGLTPKVQGNRILVVFPQLNEEQREKYVKLVGQHVEEHRQRIRNERDEVRKKVKAAFDAKTITEDDKFRIEKDIDSANTKLMEEIQQMKDKKEAQIREV
jgi:ribosome recycling factor